MGTRGLGGVLMGDCISTGASDGVQQGAMSPVVAFASSLRRALARVALARRVHSPGGSLAAAAAGAAVLLGGKAGAAPSGKGLTQLPEHWKPPAGARPETLVQVVQSFAASGDQGRCVAALHAMAVGESERAATAAKAAQARIRSRSSRLSSVVAAVRSGAGSDSEGEDREEDRPRSDPRKGGLADGSQLGAAAARGLGVGRLTRIGRHPHLAVPSSLAMGDPALGTEAARAAVALVLRDDCTAQGSSGSEAGAEGTGVQTIATLTGPMEGDALKRLAFECGRAVLRCQERCVSLSGLCPSDVVLRREGGAALVRGLDCLEPMEPLAAFVTAAHTPDCKPLVRAVAARAAAGWQRVKHELPMALNRMRAWLETKLSGVHGRKVVDRLCCASPEALLSTGGISPSEVVGVLLGQSGQGGKLGPACEDACMPARMPQADCWRLGCCLHKACTGRHVVDPSEVAAALGPTFTLRRVILEVWGGMARGLGAGGLQEVAGGGSSPLLMDDVIGLQQRLKGIDAAGSGLVALDAAGEAGGASSIRGLLEA